MLIQTVGITIAIFAVALIALSAGYLMRGRCLSGTCGGESVRVGGETLSCSSCPKRKNQECSDPAPSDRCEIPDHQHT